ncbi:uncharacterized protein MONOS_16970 [Monocercomonoides exilis]|uniref:uncharacterized protein n=1 Tax=Monocercomonoides exilis TaxID=2049356 RepID=UPI00355AC8DE|nr:hypothetical protein MONOS_16970 [Monocercomonoides exilis]
MQRKTSELTNRTAKSAPRKTAVASACLIQRERLTLHVLFAGCEIESAEQRIFDGEWPDAKIAQCPAFRNIAMNCVSNCSWALFSSQAHYKVR